MLCPVCSSYNPDDAAACRVCGSPLGEAATGTSTDALPPGTSLAGGNFTIGKVLGQGGFGITYLGSYVRQRHAVAIKEFFPYGSVRQGKMVRPSGSMSQEDYLEAKQKFLDEANLLSRFKHPGIVRVYTVFEENNTAYMVMDYLKGKTLSKILEERGRIPEREATAYIRQVGQALAIVHRAGLLHRDIKPDNIVITDDGRVVLIDFGSARGFAAGKTRRMTALLTPGYAPLEQYAEMAQRGPYTDVYALAATLYHLVTGQMPVQATDRAAGVELKPPRELNPHISRSLNDAIMWAMGMKVDERPQSVSEFLRALRQFVPIPRRQSQRPSPAPPAQPQPRQRRPPKPQPRPVPPPQPQWPDTLFQWPGPGTPVFDHCASALIGAFAGGIGGAYLSGMAGFILGAMFGFTVGIALGKTFVYLLITGLMTYVGYWASPLIARHFNFTSQYVPLIGIASGFILGALVSLAIDRKWRR